MALPFFSRNLGVRRLAVLLAVMGCVAGVVKVLPAFRSLENQRYWSKYIRSWVSAYPGSHLVEGRWGEVLLVERKPTPALPPLPKGYSFADAPATSEPNASPDVIIRSFGYTSPDPPGLSGYGLLALVILAYTAVPFLCPHAIAWIATGFRAKPSTHL